MNEDSADRVLLAAAMDGDHSAFLAIFRRYGTRIFKFLYRFLGSAKAAEDITHDCFLELVRNSAKARFTDNSPLIQLYSTARNLAIERSREHSEETKPDGEIDEESVEAVKQSIKALPCVERETLILFEYERLSIRDIGQIVEADEDVVQMRLNHAREKMRAALSREADTL
jgi:RNA polymerase sigma factor (sigma-70 family)